MADCHYEIERTMTKPSAGGTVTPTTTEESSWNKSDDNDDDVIRCVAASRSESKAVLRKRRRAEAASPRTGIPRKTARRTGEKESGHPPDERAPVDVHEKRQENVHNETTKLPIITNSSYSRDLSNECSVEAPKISTRMRDCVGSDDANFDNFSKHLNDAVEGNVDSLVDGEDLVAKESFASQFDRSESSDPVADEKEQVEKLSTKPPMHPHAPRKRSMGLAGGINRRDDSARLRKTIQWLEEGARKLREDLADTRAELYEERRAARLARRDIEVTVREARAAETAKHHRIIAELKTRLSQSPSRLTTESSTASAKAELLKDENHRREISAAKKRLNEADATIRKLRSSSLDPPVGNVGEKRRKLEAPAASELRKLNNDVKTLRATNKKMEEKLNMVIAEAERVRIMELRIQQENHEAEINALKKSLRSDAIRMMDEIRSKDRQLERLAGRLNRENRKSFAKEDDTMRKLRENENGHQIRLAARIEDKTPQVDNVIDLCKGDYEAVAEVDRLRQLAIEQQEVIELLRQAVKEKERKMDQLLNKRRKEEFYKQWLELEPVAEVDDEEEHEEGDSALSSAPSSLSPQPGGCGHWQNNGVTREAYEAVLLEIDQLQTKFLEEQQELAHAKSQVRDLEKALLQETRGSQNSRRALSEKLRKLEEREANLLAEISELGEQNELLEFRVLELEESSGLRETSDTADSGIVSPEPIHIFKEQNNKQRDRAVATVLPFSAYTHPTSPIPVKKASLSLQESGIFEGDDEDNEDDNEEIGENDREIEFTSCGTQTEAPVGELLQEVQRLQELRERIQERAVKVPSSSGLDVKSTATLEFAETKVQEDSASSYREKICQLEERLSSLEEEQKYREKNDLIVKQREDDLLDENYRLTERVYWLENELRNFENEKKSFTDTETMTETNGLFVHAETMTEASKRITSDVETMTEEIMEQSGSASSNVSSIFRYANIFRNGDREDMNRDEVTSKTSATTNDDFRLEQKLRMSEVNEKSIGECSNCNILRRDYAEKMEQLGKAERRFRGRLNDLERKEFAFSKIPKQSDVTWSQLEANHAKNLEEIGRKLEEKVECNREILQRVAELEMLASRERKKESCSCKCYDASSNFNAISSSISSADTAQRETKYTSFVGMDQVDAADDNEQMDVDVSEEKITEATKMTMQVDRQSRTDRGESLKYGDFSSAKQRIGEMESESLRRVSISGLTVRKAVPVSMVDTSTEIAVEATEDIEDKYAMRADIDGPVSRVRVLTTEERPAPEPTENLRVTINETELEKKVRESCRNEKVDWEVEGWVTKTWNTESYNHKGGSTNSANGNGARKYVFSHGGLRYVLYPEICI